MKEWPIDHPKAKVMARKRVAIIDAARDAFLRHGYGGTTMEAIAAEAKVSIMTLYRHAESKDDLFSSVIASACHPGDAEEQEHLAAVLERPLAEILEFVGMMFQDRISSPQTISLFRAVMAETSKFPQLADMAYQGLVVDHEHRLNAFLESRAEAAEISKERRRKLCSAFFDCLMGTDSLRVLMGLSPASPTRKRERARSAAKALISAFPS